MSLQVFLVYISFRGISQWYISTVPLLHLIPLEERRERTRCCRSWEFVASTSWYLLLPFTTSSLAASHHRVRQPHLNDALSPPPTPSHPVPLPQHSLPLFFSSRSTSMAPLFETRALGDDLPSDDDEEMDLGVGTSTGAGYKGLGGARPLTIAALLENRVVFVAALHTSTADEIPYTPINVKVVAPVSLYEWTGAQELTV